MSQMNGVLKDFLDMRRNLHKSSSEPTAAVKDARKKQLAAKTAPTADNGTPPEITLARIIEDKPKRKEVEAFLQTECDKMTKDKMK
jgi:hypothetical protein